MQLRDFSVIQTGNCDVHESPVLPPGHFILKATKKVMARFHPIAIDKDGVEVLGEKTVIHFVPEDVRQIRFFNNGPARVEILTASDCDWLFIELSRGEQLDYTPVEIPLGMQKPLTLREEMKRFIREAISSHADSEGYESWQEADDFDMDDEWLDFPTTPYELKEETFDTAQPLVENKPSETKKVKDNGKPKKGNGNSDENRGPNPGTSKNSSEIDES